MFLVKTDIVFHGWHSVENIIGSICPKTQYSWEWEKERSNSRLNNIQLPFLPHEIRCYFIVVAKCISCQLTIRRVRDQENINTRIQWIVRYIYVCYKKKCGLQNIYTILSHTNSTTESAQSKQNDKENLFYLSYIKGKKQ